MFVPSSPREIDLPYDAWRPHQAETVDAILQRPATHLVVNAPTGSGKSLIAAALPLLDRDHRHVTLTATKNLQQQYLETFPHLTDIRGASNYRCLAASNEFAGWFTGRRQSRVTCDEGPCHVGERCTLKDSGCDYFDQKRTFINAHAGLTNYAAWLMNRRKGAGGVGLGHADTLICDEAHALPEQLMSAYGVDIPQYLLTHLLDDRPAPRGYKEWAKWALAALDQLTKVKSIAGVRREHLKEGLERMATMDDTWAWERTDRGYRFEPTIPKYLLPLLQTFDGRSIVVYLSATVTPAMLDVLGVDSSDVWAAPTIPSTFPVANRPIYIVPGARNDYRSMKSTETFYRMIDAIDDIIARRLDGKGIIHSVSFARAEDIYDNSRHQDWMLLHKAGVPGQKIVEQFRLSRPGTILVSPSVMTGVDFPGATAEFQILPKLPFPNTQSAIMKARIRSTPSYRDYHTMTQLVQACGRINRSAEDVAETFIVDEHFKWWYPKNRDLAPDWFDEALIFTRRTVLPPTRIGR